MANLHSAWFLDGKISTCFRHVFGSHSFPCQSLLLSTTTLNDSSSCFIFNTGLVLDQHLVSSAQYRISVAYGVQSYCALKYAGKPWIQYPQTFFTIQ